MFPQPPGWVLARLSPDSMAAAADVCCLYCCRFTRKPVGPAEFLPILLSSSALAARSDPLTYSAPAASVPRALSPSDLTLFLNDLAARFAGDGLDDILEATLSFLFQEFYRVQPPVDLVGDVWREYLGGLLLTCQVKAIAGMVRQ